MPFLMSRFILVVLFSLSMFYSNGQEYSFKATSPIVQATMHRAVTNAEKFIIHTIPSDIYKAHFSLITSLSAVQTDYASYHYTPYLDDTISFIPGKYELRYLIKIGKDTLTDSFVIPVDSLGNVDVDTPDFHYKLDDLKAYKKLFTGQYRFDFESVKQFIKEKRLKNYSIVFMNSMSTLNNKNYKTLKVFKHYWYVTEYRNGGYRTIYTIDPDTGKITIKSVKMRAVA